jgi:hypothetical protein
VWIRAPPIKISSRPAVLETGTPSFRGVHVELRTAVLSLVGSFSERSVALWIARELLDETPHVVMQTFDDQDRLVAEALISRRRDQPKNR